MNMARHYSQVKVPENDIFDVPCSILRWEQQFQERGMWTNCLMEGPQVGTSSGFLLLVLLQKMDGKPAQSVAQKEFIDFVKGAKANIATVFGSLRASLGA